MEFKEVEIFDAFEKIMLHAHFGNWVPDWQVAKEIYQKFENSYSVLAPFAYAYLEELIRSTTDEYGVEIYDKNGNPKKRKLGISLINLAIEQNKHKNPEYILLLDEMKVYFKTSTRYNEGDNRNSVLHGYMHPRYWSRESFEKLIFDIAKLSKYAGF